MNDIVIQRFRGYTTLTAEQSKEALREIIQEIALLGLWRSKFFEHAAFYGGTSLRILYGLDRFSEDLDFSLLAENPSFKLASFCSSVAEELTAYGFDVNIEVKEKNTQTKIESAFIKRDTLTHLIKIGSTHHAMKGEKLKIKFEVDVRPALGFTTEAKQFFWPHPFAIKTCDLPSLFSGKLHALFCRERIKNVKGRDYYDFLWFIGQKVKPNWAYLENKLRQSGHWHQQTSFSENAFKLWAKSRLESVNIPLAKKDIVRFIKNPRALDGWSCELFNEALDAL